ncbi:hypothetical protein V9K67_24795 [Paraflavisolibacter sp. H34]|uniref:hypothetical protein n=1 Tax=Huijunlia imazamoxiresistens TaxID=3127457 RepID=UPI00301A585A
MGKFYSCLVLAVLLASSFVADAKILRVGYNGAALAGVDYSSIDNANNAANAGDTIQIYGYQGGSISKQLVVQGFGYNFDVHPGLQVIGTDAPSDGYIYFQAGSENSILEGCNMDAYIYTSNITVRRCFGNVTLYNDQRVINNVKVISSVITGGGMAYNGYNPVTNFQAYNCILQYGIGFYLPESSGAFVNCVSGSPNIYGASPLSLNNAAFLVKNCILGYHNTGNINTVYDNNYFMQAAPNPLPQGSNNRWGVSFSDLFKRLDGTSDNPSWYGYGEFDENYFLLSATSPALNGGFDGSNNPTDCGIFGGEAAYRYKISGVPPVPAVYKLTAPGSSASSNPYNITISVRSNN